MAMLTTNNPFMLGFDSLERMLDRAAKNSESYPPYNIEQIDPSHLQITVAVAGFSEEDLSLEIEDKQLTNMAGLNQSVPDFIKNGSQPSL